MFAAWAQPTAAWFAIQPGCAAVLQAVRGVAVPAGTKEEPLPRVLALLPGVHLEAESAEAFRCA